MGAIMGCPRWRGERQEDYLGISQGHRRRDCRQRKQQEQGGVTARQPLRMAETLNIKVV
jgi:hypothetical protein